MQDEKIRPEVFRLWEIAFSFGPTKIENRRIFMCAHIENRMSH
ncbi:hypothetical protein NE619_01755 [Anaerovorax odorimutans]|uniref:Uncharacterized protein n=1 Tax=Anaerovorax odorimutans TaxID=109327 RepID=A0ABT1RJT5_9FIRM|nr:hypothetical protein [Anaerovorax odorimutans]MCQ4635442.1 hypothetical protein [Anaerovorax odorimutans]